MSVTRRLEGRVALITGAARGIGLAIGERFVADGARVWLTDVREEAGRAAAASLGEAATFRVLDVRDQAHWRSVVDELVEREGRLDVLVNNAGITGFEDGATGPQDPEHVSLEDWRAVHATNLEGVFLGCREAIRVMRHNHDRGGSIINISSRSGLVGIPAAAAYASSKAAVRNHTKTVALYCAEQGLAIRCNSIHPAAILTPMWEPMLGEGEAREQAMREFVRDTPMRRFGTVEEVAGVAAMLAADESAYMTGTELHVDGGILAGSAASPERES